MTIAASCDKVFAVVAELDSGDSVLMSFQRVNVSSLQQVENLCDSVVSSCDHKISRQMEVAARHTSVEDSIVLNQLAHFEIKNLHSGVLLCHRDQVAVFVPTQLVPEAFFIFERVNLLAGFEVENLQCFVLGTACNHFVIR